MNSLEKLTHRRAAMNGLSMQDLIDSGTAWLLEGHVGREAMRMIESGICILGPVGHRDYWGNYVPSRDEVEPGTKGSVQYANRLRAERGDPPLEVQS